MLVTGVASLPSLGLVVTAGMMTVVVAVVSAGVEGDDVAIYKSRYMRRCR